MKGNAMRGMVKNSGTFVHNPKNQVKSSSTESVARGGDLRSRPTGGSAMLKGKKDQA